jgi:hypothetical protein
MTPVASKDLSNGYEAAAAEFISIRRSGERSDIITGNESVSLGRDGYQAALRASGLTLMSETDDEGGNHYYFVRKY